MASAFQILHIIAGISLVVLVLLQSSKGGLGAAFGGGEVYRTRRGAERVVFTLTIATSVIFLLTSIITLLIRP